jgi:hypothetical protein
VDDTSECLSPEGTASVSSGGSRPLWVQIRLAVGQIGMKKTESA